MCLGKLGWNFFRLGECGMMLEGLALSYGLLAILDKLLGNNIISCGYTSGIS